MSSDNSYAVQNINSANNLKLDDPVTNLSGVSTARKDALASLGITNIRDLLNYFPRNYIDLSELSTILDSKTGFNYTICATVHSIEEKEPKPGVKLIEITVVDETGTLIATAFRQNWLLDTVKPQDKIAIAGKVEFNYGFKRMTNPFIYVLDDESNMQDIAKVIPIYNANEKISSAWIKRIINNAFEYTEGCESPIPTYLEEKYRLIPYFQALKNCHFPANMKDLEMAKRTIKYSQVLFQQLDLLKSNNLKNKNTFISCEFVEDKLTNIAQAISLYKDGENQSIMITSSALMLAQYKKVLKEKLDKLGVVFALIDENTSKENKWKATYDLQNGHIDSLICTKEILDLELKSQNLKLLIVDEKSDFSKQEISKFFSLANEDADVLYLSSKPITKTFAKLLYPNSQFINVGYTKTHKCEINVMLKDDSAICYDEALQHSYKDGQIAIICPLVGLDSNARNELAGIQDANFNVKIPGKDISYEIVSMDSSNQFSQDNSQAAIKKFGMFENRIFRECDCGLIHASMPTKDKLKILCEFENGKINLLVCACSLDFVISSKNAMYIIVEDADRLGLSQLHQIRNFAIRNSDDSKITLLCTSKRKDAVKRLNFMKEIMDGQSLVKHDLNLRKEGSSLGLQSWGFHKLKLINIVRDEKIIDCANVDAFEIWNDCDKLNQTENKILSYEISRTFKD